MDRTYRSLCPRAEQSARAQPSEEGKHRFLGIVFTRPQECTRLQVVHVGEVLVALPTGDLIHADDVASY